MGQLLNVIFASEHMIKLHPKELWRQLVAINKVPLWCIPQYNILLIEVIAIYTKEGAIVMMFFEYITRVWQEVPTTSTCDLSITSLTSLGHGLLLVTTNFKTKWIAGVQQPLSWQPLTIKKLILKATHKKFVMRNINCSKSCDRARLKGYSKMIL